MSIVKIRHRQYTDGHEIRWKNKGVSVSIEEPGSVRIEFNVADGNADKPRSMHKNARGKVASTLIQISPEAIALLCACWFAAKETELGKERLTERFKKEEEGCRGDLSE